MAAASVCCSNGDSTQLQRYTPDPMRQESTLAVSYGSQSASLSKARSFDWEVPASPNGFASVLQRALDALEGPRRRGASHDHVPQRTADDAEEAEETDEEDTPYIRHSATPEFSSSYPDFHRSKQHMSILNKVHGILRPVAAHVPRAPLPPLSQPAAGRAERLKPKGPVPGPAPAEPSGSLADSPAPSSTASPSRSMPAPHAVRCAPPVRDHHTHAPSRRDAPLVPTLPDAFPRIEPQPPLFPAGPAEQAQASGAAECGDAPGGVTAPLASSCGHQSVVRTQAFDFPPPGQKLVIVRRPGADVQPVTARAAPQPEPLQLQLQPWSSYRLGAPQGFFGITDLDIYKYGLSWANANANVLRRSCPAAPSAPSGPCAVSGAPYATADAMEWWALSPRRGGEDAASSLLSALKLEEQGAGAGLQARRDGGAGGAPSVLLPLVPPPPLMSDAEAAPRAYAGEKPFSISHTIRLGRQSIADGVAEAQATGRPPVPRPTAMRGRAPPFLLDGHTNGRSPDSGGSSRSGSAGHARGGSRSCPRMRGPHPEVLLAPIGRPAPRARR